MARHRFGGGSADWAVSAGAGGAAILATSQTITFYDALTGGTHLTDLQTTGGAAITSITTDSAGEMPEFLGPPGVWKLAADANGGAGPRRWIFTSDGFLPIPTGTATAGQVPIAAGGGQDTAWGTITGGGGPWISVLDYGAVGDDATDDTTALNSAFGAATAGQTVYAPAGAYRYSGQLTLPYGASLTGAGAGTVFKPTAAAGVLYSHSTTGIGGAQGWLPGGRIRNMVIDGSLAGANAIGLDMGDGQHAYGTGPGLLIRNFTGTGAIGLYLINRFTLLEKTTFWCDFASCTNCVVFDKAAGGLPSHAYSDYLFHVDNGYSNFPGNIMVAQGGINISHARISIRGNMSSVAGTPGTAITFTGNSTWNGGVLELALEADGTALNGPIPMSIGTGSSVDLFGTAEFINLSGQTGWGTSTVTGTFKFQGNLNGDTTLTVPATPTLPASGVTQNNTGVPVYVMVWGGTVSAVNVAGQSTGLTSGAFYVPPGGRISVNYTVAPTWKWIGALAR